MFKIWARTNKGDKITKSLIYNGEGKFESKILRSCLVDICDSLDIPTPVLLKSHIKNFDSFGITRFVPSDFIESVKFDSFIIEYCREDSFEKNHIYKSYLPVD